MTPKEKRDRLFKKDRPYIRPLQVFDGNEYSRDLKILWVAHQTDPFYELDPDISQEEFANNVVDMLTIRDVYLADDRNIEYKDTGPMAIISVMSDGWKIVPHVQFFKWATNRNKLRIAVSFFQMVRYSKDTGCCLVHSLEESLPLFNKCRTYGVLFPCGKIRKGDPRGDEYLYTVEGRKCQVTSE